MYIYVNKKSICYSGMRKSKGRRKKALNIKLFLGGVGFGGVVQEWNSEFGSNKVRKKSAGKDFKNFKGSA